ncbi:MAG: histidine phosphatase family protein [Clostridia bacterium]|nr:histidine phosphatase family protein [Clostridia bacterium]
MIYIVRHGQTEQNLKKKLQGRSDYPLTELGREQASAVGDAFRDAGIVFDQVYTSPLGRAVETAELIAGDVPIDVEEALIEMDYGPYEGIDLFDLPPEVEEFFRDFTNHPAPDGMEQLSSVVARAGAFLERLKAEAVHRDILLSTHAIAMKGLLEYLTPESNGAYWSTFIGNCAVYVTEYHDGTYTVPTEWSK